MKFGQLPHGAGFEFRGARFRKISAIDAVDEESGRRRLIPRSAPVSAVDVAHNVTEDRLPETVNGADLESALAACFGTLRKRLKQELLADDTERLTVLDLLMAQARHELWTDLMSRRGDREHSTARTNANEGDTDK